MEKRMTHIRVYDQDKAKLNDLSLELSNIQKSKVSIPEVLRRTINIPSLKNVLKIDAENKRRLIR